MAETSLLTELTTTETPRGQLLRVRLEPRRRGRPSFGLECGPAPEGSARPTAGGRIERAIVWISRKLDSLSSRWTTQQEKMPGWARRLLDRLQRPPRPEEALLRSLCSAELVEIEYPSDWRPRRALRRWRHLLRSGRAHHLIRAVLWAGLIPPSLLLVLIPGPNVVGFYFTYRSLTHALAWLGGGRALKGSLPIRLAPAAPAA